MEKGYPWAAAGINVSRMVAECFDLIGPMGTSGKYAASNRNCWELLSGSTQGNTEEHFEAEVVQRFAEVFCVAFQMVDEQFIASGAGYMQFNEVLVYCKDKLMIALEQKGLNNVQQLRQKLSLPDPDATQAQQSPLEVAPIVPA